MGRAAREAGNRKYQKEKAHTTKTGSNGIKGENTMAQSTIFFFFRRTFINVSAFVGHEVTPKKLSSAKSNKRLLLAEYACSQEHGM